MHSSPRRRALEVQADGRRALTAARGMAYLNDTLRWNSDEQERNHDDETLVGCIRINDDHGFVAGTG
jgi:Flp pilus assembly protein CpaB